VSITHDRRPAPVASNGQLHPSVTGAASVALVGTYPPTQCGIATFTAALANGLTETGAGRVGVVRLGNGDALSWDPRVVAEILPGLSRSRIDAARAINSHDVVMIQHEFGVFGGTDGDEILDLLDDVVVPIMVTLHTVPLRPTPGQRAVLEAVLRRADAVVTMTRIARDRLLSLYRVSADKVVTIPHGATVPTLSQAPASDHVELLTWGLLGPGKGIEWVVEALAHVADLRGAVHYTVAGQTHPKVKAARGEEYREMLKSRAGDLGVSDMVHFDDTYRRLPDLLELVAGATCVVLPYDSDDQITSGVLVDAVSAGKPVIATGFPHAAELLCGGVGILVPHKDPVAIGEAIRALVTNPALLCSMAAATAPIAADHTWNSVAAKYLSVGTSLGYRKRASA
jgi:glycosyltransferase involved in cell wall biosynthesis